MVTAEELSQFEHLAELTPAELIVLATAGREVSFPDGHRLIAEGGAADRCWLIRDGRVRLDAHVPGNKAVIVQTLDRGELLGWSWLAPPYRWQFGATAAGPVRAIEFDAVALIELATENEHFSRAFTTMLFEALIHRLQSTRARLLDLYRNPAESSCGTARSGNGRSR